MSGVPGDDGWAQRAERIKLRKARRVFKTRRDILLDEGYRDGWNDAVEQCARVVEQMVMLPYRACPADIAVAVRGLKGKS